MNSNETQHQGMAESPSPQASGRAERSVLSTRERIAIFLMAVSLLILGISFRNDIFTLVATLALRTFALLLYWFAYIFFLRLTTGHSDIEDEAQGSSKKLVFYRFMYFFGLAYAIAIVLLSFLWH